jgi:DNA primase
VLWNADRLYPVLKDVLYPEIVVVEGFKACMRVYQAGIKWVVALLGSDMSEEQQWILERLGARVILLLDRDKPGKVGTYFIGRRLVKGLDVRVGCYRPDEQDPQPSDLTRDEIYEAIGTASDYYRWKHDNREELSDLIKRTSDRG